VFLQIKWSILISVIVDLLYNFWRLWITLYLMYSCSWTGRVVTVASASNARLLNQYFLLQGKLYFGPLFRSTIFSSENSIFVIYHPRIKKDFAVRVSVLATG